MQSGMKATSGQPRALVGAGAAWPVAARPMERFWPRWHGIRIREAGQSLGLDARSLAASIDCPESRYCGFSRQAFARGDPYLAFSSTSARPSRVITREGHETERHPARCASISASVHHLPPAGLTTRSP